MKVVLELKSKISKVKRITVRQDVVLGRGSECSLRLPSSQVSRKHCSLTFCGDILSVTDLGSSNGTWLNGVKLPANQPFEIRHKMKLAVGPVQFVVHFLKDEDSKGVPAETSDANAPETIANSDNIAEDGAVVESLVDGVVSESCADSEDSTMADNSAGRLDPAPPVKSSSTGNSDSDEEILQLDESMLVNSEGHFEIPSVDAVGSEGDVDSLEVIEDFDIVDVVDEVQVVNNVEIVDDVEVLDSIEVVDDIEVLDDIQVVDEVEVIDSVEVLDDIEVLDDFDDVEVLDDDDDEDFKGFLKNMS